MSMTRVVLVLAFLAFTGSCFAEDLTPEERADIDRLLEMTGALAIGQQMNAAVIGHMTDVLRKARPDIPQRLFDMLPGEVNAVIAANMGSFKELLIPLYHRYFTGSEISDLIKFYSTDLGRKTVRVMPALLNESMQAGRQWGQALGPALDQRIKARFKREGYEL